MPQIVSHQPSFKFKFNAIHSMQPSNFEGDSLPNIESENFKLDDANSDDTEVRSFTDYDAVPVMEQVKEQKPQNLMNQQQS